MPHYIVLCQNLDLQIVSTSSDYSVSDNSGLSILPELPELYDDESLSRLIRKALKLVVKEHYDAFLEQAKKDEQRGIAACPAPVPIWISAFTIWMLHAILSGVTWDFIKVNAKRLVNKITKYELDDARFYLSEYNEEEKNQILFTYFSQDFRREEIIERLYLVLKEISEEKGQKFSLKALEYSEAEVLVNTIEKRQIEIEEEKKKFEKDKSSIIWDIIRSDLDNSSNEETAKQVCRYIDQYFINGIETPFLVPHISFDTEQVFSEIFQLIEIPEDVIASLQRHQVLDTELKLTDFGKDLLQRLASLRPSGRLSGKLPDSYFG